MFAANIQALTRDDLARALMELPTNRLFALRQRLEQRPLLIALLLAGLAALLYLPSVSFGFLGYDDHWLVAKNPILLQPSTGTLHTVFFDLSARSRYLLGSEYLPLRDLSVFVELALVGPDPRLMHLDNVLLYALGCGLLFLALKAWLSDTRLAAVAVLIYLAHPIHVESVAWLSERKGVLALVFVSASLLAFHRFALRGRLAWLLISVLLFVCAIWSKGLAIATFGVLVLLVWQHWPSSTKPSTRAKWLGLSLWFVAALLAFAPIYSTGQKLQLVGAFHGGSFGATAALMGEVHARYVGLMLLASKQGIAYPIQSATVQPLLSLFGWTLVALFAGSILYALLRSRARVPALAAGFWLVFLLPVSQLIFPLQNAMADRYLLLPSIGACLALAYAVRSIPFNWARPAIIGAVIVAQIALTLSQTRSWQDDESLYRQALVVHPTHLMPMLQLARLARQRGHIKTARWWLHRAQKAHPRSWRPAFHLGMLEHQLGRRAQAIAQLRRAARHPQGDRARANLSTLLSQIPGRLPEALRLARSAVRQKPLSAHNQAALGAVALKAGKLAVAQKALASALQLRPSDATSHVNMALLLMHLEKRLRAKEHLEKALKLAPEHRGALDLKRRLRL